MCQVECQVPASPHSTVLGTPPVSPQACLSLYGCQGEHSRGLSVAQENLGCAVLPRSLTEVKPARRFSPVLPGELVFISQSRNSNCPKPQENYKVAASDPALLSPYDE